MYAQLVAPAGEYFSVSQSVQAVLPSWVLYLPAPQSVQAVLPSWALYFPAPQSVQTPEPLIQYDPAGGRVVRQPAMFRPKKIFS